MAITSFREQWIEFAVVGMFILAMISFIVVMQEKNDVDEGIITNPIINKTFIKLDQNLSNLRNKTETQRAAYESENPERGFGSLIIFSIVGVSKIFFGLMIGIYNIIIVLPASILGLPEAIMATIEGILIVSMVLLGWALIRIGR